ncbi:uncharacterized protein Triagg1_2821 [Trichoderma aggressivum f. europaeum]|uniref:Zn(2)-C6 fungal-type domain-containing protein n=1 Tax=Trichoderma aggressivum f. europaeum TaxID=173218 RepID=A0AAE1IKG2_9HYPO|nr:hypothetical protein Triagg1_2821 [Trichoderma aggressivum f. europaeum]
MLLSMAGVTLRADYSSPPRSRVGSFIHFPASQCLKVHLARQHRVLVGLPQAPSPNPLLLLPNAEAVYHLAGLAGSRPKCISCVQKGIDCHYTSANATETNSGVLKRKFQEVKQKTSDYEEFYDALQRMPPSDSQAIFRLIRRGADIKTVMGQITEGNLLLQLSLTPETQRRYEFPFVTTMPAALQTGDNLYLRSLIFEATFHDQNQQQLTVPLNQVNTRSGSPQYIYTQPYHSAEIVNTRLSSVDVSRWTAVSADNELMRALLHAYFLHEYSSYTIFQKDIFIQALTDGDERFCSSLLVNALLAQASVFPPFEVFKQRWKQANRYSIAIRGSKIANSSGTLKISAIAFLQKLGDFGNYGPKEQIFQLYKPPCYIGDKTLRHARDFTAWCLYKYQTIMGYYYFKSPMITIPPKFPLPDPYAEPSWYGDFILKYPANNTFTSLYFPHFFCADTKLKIILNAIAVSLFKPENVGRTLPANVKSNLRAQLESWLACLSVPLHPSNIVFPAQLRLHMEYHATILTLLQTPVNNDRSFASIIMSNENDDELLQEAISAAMIRLETIVRIYYLRHSYESCNTYLTFFLSNVGFAALERLRSSEVDHERFKHMMSTLIPCIKGLYDQGQHVHVASAVYRLLRNRLLPQDLRFLQGYIHWNITEDDDPLIISHVQSEWPIPIVGREKDPEAAKLENLARRLNEMSVDSSRETSEENELETR